jgi:hypothetical protein
LQATLDNLRAKEKEGRQAAKELAEAKAQLKALEDAKLSDEEKKAKELEEAKAENQSTKALLQAQSLKLGAYALRDELGIADVDLALAVLDSKSVEWKDGEPVNLKESLEALLAAKPILKGTPEPTRKGGSSDAGGGSNGGGDAAKGLSAEELEWCKDQGVAPAAYAKSKKAGAGTLQDYLDAHAATKTT